MAEIKKFLDSTGTNYLWERMKSWVAAQGYKTTDTNTWRDVVDNLTSTVTDKSLSAKQGKVLNDKIAAIIDGSQIVQNAVDADSAGYASEAGSVAWANITGKTNATTSTAGLMSATDKSNLDTIVNSFNSDDADTTIETVKEVLKVFESYPAGTSLSNALAGKLDKTGGTLTGTVTMTGGDFLARYVGVSAAGHETSTYDKIAILSNTTNGYIRYRTKSELLSDIGAQAKVSALGSDIKPVYISAAGTFSETKQYAGGTWVTLNGVDRSGLDAYIYAPTSGGTSGQILTSSGSGNAPTWVNASSLSVGSATKATQDANGNNIVSTYLPLSGGTLTGLLKTAENTMGLKLRTHDSYETGWVYGTTGNEAITLAMQNPVTAFQIVYGTKPSAFSGSTWQSVTPLFQTKDGKVIINRKITATSETTNLKLFDVNGDANATTLYENNLPLTRKYGTLLPFGTQIGANVDLNTTAYIKVGNYFCSANTTVATLTNCPTTSAFMMQVYSPLSTSFDNESTGTWVYRLRKLLTYTGDEYVQQIYSGSTAGTFTYGAWRKIAKTEDLSSYVTLTGSQALTNKTYNGYTLGAACAKGVTDSTSASALSTGTNLVTERDVYYGLASINGARQTSSVGIYAPTSAGTSGQVLTSNGSGAPTWATLSTSGGSGAVTKLFSGSIMLSDIGSYISTSYNTYLITLSSAYYALGDDSGPAFLVVTKSSSNYYCMLGVLMYSDSDIYNIQAYYMPSSGAVGSDVIDVDAAYVSEIYAFA